MDLELTARLDTLDLDPDLATSTTSSLPSSSASTNDAASLQTATSSAPASDDEGDLDIINCEVKATSDRGQAVYATRRLRPGTLIFAEAPLVALTKELEDSSEAIEAAFAKLGKRDKKTYRSLFDAQKSRMSAVVSIYYSNCYSTESFASLPALGSEILESNRPGSCIGALSSRINHGCIPNVAFSYLLPTAARPTGQMRFYAVRSIARGKELLSNYEKNIFDRMAERQRGFLLHYGFRCSCEACAPRTEFWARSDERRTAMREIVSGLKGFETRWMKLDDVAHEQRLEICRLAIVELKNLEVLLVKEGLTATPLANAYKSLAKWVERMGKGSRGWREMELKTVVTMSGKNSLRSVFLKEELKRAQC
jgi:hypothetical protein